MGYSLPADEAYMYWKGEEMAGNEPDISIAFDLGNSGGKSDYRRIIAVSGGSRNALLNQMIADASGMAVSAGDPKATCLGNLLVQFYALGRLDSYEAMQAEAERFCKMKDFAPAGGM